MATLKFDTLEELQTFFVENALNIQDYQLIGQPQIKVETPEEEVVVENSVIPESVNLTLNTLSSSPIIEAKVGDENIIYVDECDNLKNACSTTRIKFMERYIFVNVCDCEGSTTINLDIALNETVMYNVPFEVKEKQADSPVIQINKDMLCKPNPPL